MMGQMRTLAEIEHLRYHAKSCLTCRYIRHHKQEHAITSECLLLGRTMGIVSKEAHLLSEWDKTRVCDGWKKRPMTWEIVMKDNPHWHDKYYKRETLQKMHRKIENRYKVNG